MAVIDKAGVNLVDTYGLGSGFGDVVSWIRKSIADDLWRFYEENPDRAVVTLNKWFFSFTVRVKHLEPLFELLLGPRP